MIKSVGSRLYKVFSKRTGKALSKSISKKAAVKRLQQIEYFKHKGAK